jgi:acid phosphatase family membrane protein YuiD
MKFWTDLLNNFPLVCAGTAWFTAQIIKVFTGVFKMREFSITALLFGNGGMPSSHSAAVCALAVSCALAHGAGSGYFAIAFLFAIIVMGDAAGVRAETGKQSKLLNRIVKDLFDPEHQSEVNQNLKELVGHTPLQVVMGALLGIAVPFLMALIPLYSVHMPL